MVEGTTPPNGSDFHCGPALEDQVPMVEREADTPMTKKPQLKDLLVEALPGR